ncbi:MAG: hypothetical protein P8Y42_11040 [Exilibacterium sp.]
MERGYDIRTIQELLGHADVATTEIWLARAGKASLAPWISDCLAFH